MRYNKIRKMDIADGPGVRVSIFMQGCAFNCPKCFNQETHDFAGGKEFTQNTINKVLELCDNPNIEGTKELAKAFKEKYPEKNVWVWSGYTFEKDLKDKEALKYVDVLVDGQYVDALHNPTLEWRGSSNQRVINVPESLKENKTVLRKIAQ